MVIPSEITWAQITWILWNKQTLQGIGQFRPLWNAVLKEIGFPEWPLLWKSYHESTSPPSPLEQHPWEPGRVIRARLCQCLSSWRSPQVCSLKVVFPNLKKEVKDFIYQNKLSWDL